MKQLLVLVILALLVVSTARGQGPDDQYLSVYTLIQEADGTPQPTQALAKYLQAQTSLQRLQRSYPDWNAKVVGFRLNYLALKIETLSAKAPAPPAASNSVGVVAQDRAATPQASSPNDSDRQLNELKQRLQQLEADKVVLEAKLKEALAAQPAALDPRELSNALSQVQSLEKENQLLKVTLAQEKGRTQAMPVGKPGALSAADVNQKLAEQTERANRLELERDALQARQPATGPYGAAALQAENVLLRKQLAELKTGPASGPAEAGSRLAEAQKQIAALQADKELLRLEKVALENRVKQMAVSTNAAPLMAKAAEPSRVRELEGERKLLQKKLDEAMKELYNRKGKALSARLEGMEGQILALRSRLEVFEAHQVPYTAEELALFNKPEPKIVAAAQPDPRAGKKSVRELPPGSTPLIAEAQKFFAAKQYDKAEENYLQVLNKDQSNVPTLANLALIQLQLNRTAEADKHIQQAIKIDPDDAYSLSVLGQVKFRQEKYDEALEALARAAKLDAQNAEIQNLLGLTLSQKGLRGPAETALRKAIQINPGYGEAHNNLAVIYLSQQPPLVELARWHYQKARAAGNPANPFLEKAFEARKTASTSP
jgi:tetratricopeptide (TPR) repeat protein